MRRVLIIAAACAPLLAACASDGPRAPELATPAAFEAPSRGQALPAAALDQWWTLYGDAQLTALVEEALSDSFDVRSAASRLEQARAIRQSALNQYNPQGALGGSASRGRTEVMDGASALEGDSESASLNFDVSWELDVFGRRAASRRSADADLRTAEFTYESTRASLAANVADSLFQARGLAIQLAEAQETLRVQEQLLSVARAKVEHGLTPGSDRAQTEANVQASRAQAESLQAQLTAARRSLLLLLGRATDPLANLEVPATVGTLPPAPAAVPGELLARRPDVREAEWRLAAAAGDLTLAQRAFFPTFTLQPGVGLSSGSGTTSGSWR